jgi:hypothetical protein
VPGRPPTTLSRDGIIAGLKDVIRALRLGGHRGRMGIVGGAAIALTLNADRRATRDVDGPLAPADVFRSAAAQIADQRGWAVDWLNDSAAQFLPNGFGRSAEWVTIHDDDGVCVEVASPETLLAMKLYAAEKRYLREADDLAVLLHATKIETVDDAEHLYGEFYPGDQFSVRLFELVEAVLAAPFAGSPPPPFPDLS